MTNAAEKIIVALDVPSQKEAMKLVTDLHSSVGMFKVGLQLYTAAGAGIVGGISFISRIFLDLKLHDIPNTVGRAVESAGTREVEMLTIHLSGGSEMIRAATAAAKGKTSILGVTVLTSKRYGKREFRKRLRSTSCVWRDWVLKTESMELSRVHMKLRSCALNSVTKSKSLPQEFVRVGRKPATRSEP